MTTDNPYRALPSVDRLVAHERLGSLREEAPLVLTQIARQALEAARGAIAGGTPPPGEEQIVENVLALTQAVLQPSLRPVINASGVIIHTNLGRSPLSDEAIAAMTAVSSGYSNLEFDLDTGERGSRYVHLEPILTRLTGAEAAMAVNNNAAALLLALSALAAGREVIISRGQAVEIGGGFRIPDVMAQSGARLVEVGTTNRTYVRDYRSAITPDTAAIMRVHASNFRIIGFTESPSIQGLARLAHEHSLLLLDDIGSGCLLDTTRFGLAPEPTVQESLDAGADLTLFSGDKLLGGPQAGVIVGRGALVDQLRRHPLARAVRMDKGSIAALTATLLHYIREEALYRVPVWRMIAMPLVDIDRRARRWARAIGHGARLVDGRSMVGGGSLPEESLPTRLVSISEPRGQVAPGPGDGAFLSDLSRRLRAGDPPVVARIEHDALLLDPRTVDPAQDTALITALKRALQSA